MGARLFNDQRQTLMVRTRQGGRLDFDLKTGGIASSFRPLRVGLAISISSLGVVYLFILIEL
jgi:hypothetical protein